MRLPPPPFSRRTWILVTLVALALIGTGVGLAAQQTNPPVKNAAVHPSSTPTVTPTSLAPSPSAAPSFSPPPTPTNSRASSTLQTLVIKEFGVQFPVDGKLGNVTYQTMTNQTDLQSIGFNSSVLSNYADQHDPKNWCKNAGSLGMLYRRVTADDANAKNLVGHIGGYYYYEESVQNVCSANEDVYTLQGQLIRVLLDDLKSLAQAT